MSIYATDVWGIHKLCVDNPWVAVNAVPKYQGSSTSTFPCHYDYAIVHVPTMLAEQSVDNSVFYVILAFGLVSMFLWGWSVGQRIFYK